MARKTTVAGTEIVNSYASRGNWIDVSRIQGKPAGTKLMISFTQTRGGLSGPTAEVSYQPHDLIGLKHVDGQPVVTGMLGREIREMYYHTDSDVALLEEAFLALPEEYRAPFQEAWAAHLASKPANAGDAAPDQRPLVVG